MRPACLKFQKCCLGLHVNTKFLKLLDDSKVWVDKANRTLKEQHLFISVNLGKSYSE